MRSALRTRARGPSPLIIEGAFYNAQAPGPGSFLPRADVALETEYRTDH